VELYILSFSAFPYYIFVLASKHFSRHKPVAHTVNRPSSHPTNHTKTYSPSVVYCLACLPLDPRLAGSNTQRTMDF
jgi:hypothetical protein